MPVKVMNADGEGDVKDAAEGIIWAADNGANIINLSIEVINDSEFLHRAVDYAIGKNVSVVVAAGNDGGKVTFPAAYKNVIAVGSVGKNKLYSGFSNNGENLTVDAPGEEIMSTVPDNKYEEMDGTFMATPIVTGVIALMLTKTSDFNPINIKNKILKNSADLAKINWDNTVEIQKQNDPNFAKNMEDYAKRMPDRFKAWKETWGKDGGSGLIDPSALLN